jgi:hypothetical protein
METEIGHDPSVSKCKDPEFPFCGHFLAKSAYPAMEKPSNRP